MAATAGALLGTDYLVPLEERAQREARSMESYEHLVDRLSRQSVTKHFDAYADVPWEEEAYRIDPADPRWILPESDPLGATNWYKSQPSAVRSRIGLHHYATLMKIGLQFESALKRGLLDFAFDLPNGAPEFRYCYHEVIEEAQHSLMFQEFVNRSGLPVKGLPPVLKFGSRIVVRMARRFPELFFMFVMGGEDPIDYIQRDLLRGHRDLHPLLRRIMQIHVTEEARHLCFARAYLRENVGKLSRWRRLVLSIRTPLLLHQMAALMMRPSPAVIAAYGIPREVVVEAYENNVEFAHRRRESLRKVRELCEELGIFRASLWRRLGLWSPSGQSQVAHLH